MCMQHASSGAYNHCQLKNCNIDGNPVLVFLSTSNSPNPEKDGASART